MAKRPPKVVAAILGAMLIAGLAVGGLVLANASSTEECSPVATEADWSVARQWDEALLDAIRRDLPAPTVHARNLFHTSAAMWDAWAAYDTTASGYYVSETHPASDVETARHEAISYAAYRVLDARYIDSVGASETIPELDALMESLCYPIDFTSEEGDTPAAVGNRIARIILEATVDDGSNELEGYDDPSYEPVNSPLIVDSDEGTTMNDPNGWQPLQIEQMISQNGIPVENGVQEFVDPHWGYVVGFALSNAGPAGLPIDPGAPPLLGNPVTDQDFKESAVEVIGYSSRLDPAGDLKIDISPASLGGSTIGTNDGSGHPLNPITGNPYEENVVNQADYGRVLAEFWADGPNSETPPGHWNTVANTVSDRLAPELRIGGEGPVVERLEWDVKLYLALNGANHDAAIAAWGSKNYYDYVRPISMIRYMGGLGQSSDPSLPSFHPDGLLLTPELVELVTEQSAAPGERHEHLADHVGEVAVLAWMGNPDDPETETGGVSWILAITWVPYQKPTFVTPAFASYVSGHSTFSRASAEVMTGITGSEFFPGGLGAWTISADALEFESGPESDITLQWATYGDAADQAGLSRLHGGIHVRADDFAGRLMGATIGRAAWEEALRYYSGTTHG